jgi:hypothetical protein
MKQPFKIINKNDLSKASDFEFWAWSLVTFRMDSARYLIQPHNFCVPISEQAYQGIKIWSDPLNSVEASALKDFVRIEPSLQPGGNEESASNNLKSMTESLKLRQSIFGAQLKPIPIEDSHFGCWFICSSRKNDSHEGVNAILAMSFPPRFEDFRSAVGQTFVASQNALSAIEIEKVRSSKYEVAMGSEAVSLIDPKSQLELSLSPDFYHWDSRGPMTILSEKINPLPSGPAYKDHPGLASEFYFSRF